MPRGVLPASLCALSLALLAWGALALAGGPREIRTEILIGAPPEEVWRVLEATGEYPYWNPLLTSVEGRVGPGETLAITARQPEGWTLHFRARVTVYERERELRWRGGLAVPGLLEGEHWLRLEAAPGGATRLSHGERYTGLLVGAWLDGFFARNEAGFHAMNAALRQRCERPR